MNTSDCNSPCQQTSDDSSLEDPGKGDDSSQQDYMLVYSEIETSEQSSRYTKDFNREYKEYRKLHNKVAEKSVEFEYFQMCISNLEEGPQAYKKLYDPVLAKYKKRQSDIQFHLHKRRLDYLHGKVSHIKQVIKRDKRPKRQGGENGTHDL